MFYSFSNYYHFAAMKNGIKKKEKEEEQVHKPEVHEMMNLSKKFMIGNNEKHIHGGANSCFDA